VIPQASGIVFKNLSKLVVGISSYLVIPTTGSGAFSHLIGAGQEIFSRYTYMDLRSPYGFRDVASAFLKSCNQHLEAGGYSG
jgi:hypothetical protein